MSGGIPVKYNLQGDAKAAWKRVHSIDRTLRAKRFGALERLLAEHVLSTILSADEKQGQAILQDLQSLADERYLPLSRRTNLSLQQRIVGFRLFTILANRAKNNDYAHALAQFRRQFTPEMCAELDKETQAAHLKIIDVATAPPAALTGEQRLKVTKAYPLPHSEIRRQIGKGKIADAYDSIFNSYQNLRIARQEKEALRQIDRIMERVSEIVGDSSVRMEGMNPDLAESLMSVLEDCASRPLEAQGKAIEEDTESVENDDVAIERARKACEYIWAVAPDRVEAIDRIISIAESEVLAFEASTIIGDLMIRKGLALSDEQTERVVAIYSSMGEFYLDAMRGHVEEIEIPDEYIFEIMAAPLERGIGIESEALYQSLLDALRILINGGRNLDLILSLSGRLIYLLPTEGGAVYDSIVLELAEMLGGLDRGRIEKELPIDGQYEAKVIGRMEGLTEISSLIPQISGRISALHDRQIEEDYGYNTPAHFNAQVSDSGLRRAYERLYSSLSAAHPEEYMQQALTALGNFVDRLGEGEVAVEGEPRESVLLMASLLQELFFGQGNFDGAMAAARHRFSILQDADEYIESMLAIAEAEVKETGRSSKAKVLFESEDTVPGKKKRKRVVAIYERSAAWRLKQENETAIDELFSEAEVYLAAGMAQRPRIYRPLVDAVSRILKNQRGADAMPRIQIIWEYLSPQNTRELNRVKDELKKVVTAEADQLAQPISEADDLDTLGTYRALLEGVGVCEAAPRIYLAFGQAYLRLGEFERAREAFKIVQHERGDLAEAFVGEAEVFEEEGDLEGAIEKHRIAANRGADVQGKIEELRKQIRSRAAAADWARGQTQKAEEAMDKAWEELLSSSPQTADKAASAFVEAAVAGKPARFLSDQIERTLNVIHNQAWNLFLALTHLEERHNKITATAEKGSVYTKLKNKYFDKLFEKMEKGKKLSPEEKKAFLAFSPAFLGKDAGYILGERREKIETILEDLDHEHWVLAERFLAVGEKLPSSGALEHGRFLDGLFDLASEFTMILNDCHMFRAGHTAAAGKIRTSIGKILGIMKRSPAIREIEALRISAYAQKLHEAGLFDLAVALLETLPFPMPERARKKPYYFRGHYLHVAHLYGKFERTGNNRCYMDALRLIDLMEENLPDENIISVEIKELEREVDMRSALANVKGALHLNKASQFLKEGDIEQWKTKLREAEQAIRKALKPLGESQEEVRNPLAMSDLAIISSAFRNFEEAERLLLRAIEIYPAYYRAYVRLCTVYIDMQRFDRVSEVLREYIDQLENDVAGEKDSPLNEHYVLQYQVIGLCNIYAQSEAEEILEIFKLLSTKYKDRIRAVLSGLQDEEKNSIHEDLQKFFKEQGLMN